jgi:hypothetical protein
MTHAAGHAILALALLWVAVPGSTSAKARPTRVSLEFTRRAGAHSCPSEKQLRAEVSAILGYGPFDKHARRAMVCVLWAEAGTFHARVQLRDARTRKSLGVRQLSATGPGCETLASAVALAMALAIDPLAQPPAPRVPPPAPPLAPPPAVAAAPVVPPPPAARVPSVASGSYAGAAAASSEASRSNGAARPPPPAVVEVTPPVAVAPPEVAAEKPAPPDAGPVAAALLDAGGNVAALSDAGPELAAALAVDAGPEAVVAAVPPAAPLDAGAPEAAVDAGAPPAVVAEPPKEAPATAAAAESPGEPRGIAGVGGDYTLGLVPSGAFGVVAHGGVFWSFASVELEVQWLPNTSLAFAPGSISSRLVTGALVGCAKFGDWSACGLAQAGPYTAQGHGYSPSFSTTTWVVALGARGQWDWVFVHPVGLRLHIDGLVNLVRPQLLVGSASAWTAPPVALAVGAGVFVRF